MNIQRLRNITTGRLHTEMSHIYQDMEYLVGEGGMMTHQLPNIRTAMMTWLEEKITDSEFFDGEHKPSIEGDYDIEPMTPQEREECFARFAKLPSALASLGGAYVL